MGNVFYNTLPKLPQVKLYNWGTPKIMLVFLLKDIKKMLNLVKVAMVYLQDHVVIICFVVGEFFFIDIQTLGN